MSKNTYRNEDALTRFITTDSEIEKWEAEFKELRKLDAANREEYNAACAKRKANSNRKK